MDVDQDMEFERLAAAFSTAAIEGVVMACHGSQTSADGGPRVRHLYAVSDLAARLGPAYFEDLSPNSQRYWTRACAAAGLLHEVMERGLNFEGVVGVADESVARIVGACTPDPRLPAPLRRERYVNQLGLASEAAQLVKLCDLRHEVAVRLAAVSGRARPAPATEGAALEWLEESRLVLPALAKADVLVTAPQWRRLAADLEKLGATLKKLETRRKEKES